MYKGKGSWGSATGSTTISTGIMDPTMFPAIFMNSTSGYGDNVGVTPSYNSSTGVITISGSVYGSSNDAFSVSASGQVYLFKKTFFDFSFTIYKSGSGWGAASGSTSISTGICDITKHPIVYILSTAGGPGDSKCILTSYDASTGVVTISSNAYNSTNDSFSVTITGIMMLVG